MPFHRLTTSTLHIVRRRLVLTAVALSAGCGGVSEQPTTPTVPAIVPARIRVTLEREGNSRDADGVTVTLDDRQRSLQEGTAVVFDSVTPGASVVRFTGLAAHCVGSTDSVTATVGRGATTDVSLRIHCVGALVYTEFANYDAYALQYLGEDGRIIPLTTAVARFVPDEFTRDGSRLLFSDRGSVGGVQTSHLYTVRLDGSELRQLTFGDVSDFRPRWSPDGTRIAFSRLRVVGSGFQAEGIMLMNADGTNLHSITDGQGLDHDPVWSNDASKIFFGCFRYHIHADVCEVAPDGSGLRRVSLPFVQAIDNDGCTGFCVGAGPQKFVVSPDGTAMLIETLVTPGRNSNGIWVYPFDAADATYLTPGMIGFDARWAPGSDQVLFNIAGKDNEFAIATVRRDGTGFRQLTPFDGAINESADWSPDAAMLVYDRYGEGTQQVMVMKPDGIGARRITRPPVMHSYARWNPLAHPGAPSFPVPVSASASAAPPASAFRVARPSESRTYPLLGNSKCTVTIRGAETQVACTR